MRDEKRRREKGDGRRRGAAEELLHKARFRYLPNF